MTPTPRRATVVAAVMSLMVAAIAVYPSSVEALVEGRFTIPVPVTEDGNAGNFSSPSLVATLHDPQVLYAAAVEFGTQQCVFFRSTDGGQHWEQPKASPSRPSFPFCTHTAQFVPMTAVAVGRDDAVYFAYQGWSHRDQGANPTTSVFVARSTDGGNSWSVATVRNARKADPRAAEVNYPTDLVVDTTSPAADTVYVSWTATYPGAAPARPPQPFLAVSVDGGRAFSRPVNVTGSFFGDPRNISGDIPGPFKRGEHFGGEAPELALDSRGNLFVAWVRASAALSPRPPQPRYLSRSTDRGTTFRVSELTPPSHFAGPGPVLEWSPSGSSAGSLHVVYEDKLVPDQGDRDVLYRRSIDDGQTWSEPTVLNDDDPAQLFVQLLPNLSAAPDGRLDVAWWDQRDAAGRYAVDLFYASSSDGGVSWSTNRRVTPRAIDRTAGSWVDNHGDTRQVPAVASSAGAAYFIWDYARRSRQGDAQGLAASSAQLSVIAKPHPSSGIAYLFSAITGLGAGGALGATWTRRRRRPNRR